jgi:CRISPR-associated protein Csy1
MTSIEEIEAWVRAGRHQAAFEAAGRLLDAEPHDARALIVRANTANALGRHEALIESLERLVQRHPLHPAFCRSLATAINNRGSRRRAAQDPGAALGDFRRAIDLDPRHAQAWFNLGLSARDLGQHADAAVAFTRHLELHPDDRDAQLLLAGSQTPESAGRYLDGLAAETRARFDPGWLAQTASRAGRIDATVEALDALAVGHDLTAATEAITQLRLRGAAEAARRGAERVLDVARASTQTALRAELVAALALPAIYRSRDDMHEWRQRYVAGLDRLEAEWTPTRLATLQGPLRQLAHSNFLLAYQGQDDRELQSRFARLVERAARVLQPALCEPPDPIRRSGRVGLVSSSWRNCTVGSYFGSWIGWLRAAGHEVRLYQIGPQRDAMTEQLAASATHYRYFEDSIEAIAQALRDDDLDLLIYPELGMDARLTPLAALRLARHQALGWGHPVTSGFSGFDDYLSCAEMEPPDAASHYGERLIALPRLGVDYRRPALPDIGADLPAGIDPSRPRVLVPQSLFKLHPEGDAVMARIARELPNVQFVLFEPEHAEWKQAFVERLSNAFLAVGRSAREHLQFQPLGSREQFLRVNQACDLMLDSLHWSGGNTAIDALCAGLPLVACPGALMRGRQSHAMLKRLSLDAELSCASPLAQAERCIELLHHPGRLRELSRQIRERLPQVFDSEPARHAMVDWAARTLAS